MRLTPRDIQEKEFSSVFRGYKEEEVDAFLDEVTEAYEAVFKENLDLREEVEKLREECKKYEAIGERMQGALVAAQETADDVRKNAQKEAENIVREAELKAQKMIQETKDRHLDLQKQLASLKQVEEEFRFKLKSILQSYLKLLEELPFGERKEVKELLASEEAEKVEVVTAPMEIKEEIKEKPKEEAKEEIKAEVKEEIKEEVKEEVEEEVKEEVKEEVEEKAKEEIPIPFDLEGEEKPAVRKLAPKEIKAEEVAKATKGRTAKKAKAEKKEEETAKKPEEKEEAKKAEEAPEAKEEIEIIEDETFWKDT